ncbi:MAG TPA: ABC transporter permease [Candidatus Angelobacter sp.]
MSFFFRIIPRSLQALLRTPSFAGTVIVVLGLGIAANTIIFALDDQLLLNPFPYRQPGQLVMIWEANPSRGGSAAKRVPVAWTNYAAWQAENHSFEAMEAYEIFLDYNLTGREIPEHLAAARATPGFFTMLGVNAAQGRTFSPGDDTPNSNPTIVITDAFAKKHFGSNSPLDQRLLLDGMPYTIIGVLPRKFHLPAFFEGISEYKPDIWLALPKVSSTDPPETAKRRRLVVWGRLKSNISLPRAREDMTAVAEQRRREDPDLNQGYGINVFPLEVENTDPDFRNDVRLFWLSAVVVLLLACSNLAGLMLIRGAAQKKDLAIMAALGANRWALISPILSESFILAVFAGIFGFLASYAGVHLITALKPSDIHSPERLTVNFHAFLFASGLSLVTVLIFGLIPARLTARNDITEVLKSTRSGRTPRSYARSVLISIQIAAALGLAIAAVLLVRSFRQVLAVDPGFRPQQVLTAHLSLSRQRYADVPGRARFCRQLQEKIQGLPGVESAALVDYMPLTAIRVTPFEIEGRPAPQPNAVPFTDFADVTPGFFSAMGIGVRQGRLFTEQDADADPPNMVVVNETLARQFWPNQDPVGSHIRRLSSSAGPPGPWQTVVGVFQDFRQSNVETPARPELLWPAKAFSEMTVVLRTATADPSSLSSPLQQTVWSLDHDQPLSQVQTLEQMITDMNSQRRFNMIAVGAFALFSILLTAVGMYGLVSSFISSQARGIGIRFALGARRKQVCLGLLRPAMLPVVAGIALGLGLSFLVKKILASVLFQIDPVDPMTYIGSSVVLVAILLLTSLAATIRAARVDPARVLREE